MTNRELYNTMISYLDGADTDTSVLREACVAALEKMEAQNSSRREKQAEKAAEKQAAKAPIRDAILAVMGTEDDPKTASTLIEEAGLIDTVKPASIPSLMRPLVDSGIVGKVDVKIKGKGTQRGYIRL